MPIPHEAEHAENSVHSERRQSLEHGNMHRFCGKNKKKDEIKKNEIPWPFQKCYEILYEINKKYLRYWTLRVMQKHEWYLCFKLFIERFLTILQRNNLAVQRVTGDISTHKSKVHLKSQAVRAGDRRPHQLTLTPVSLFDFVSGTGMGVAGPCFVEFNWRIYLTTAWERWTTPPLCSWCNEKKNRNKERLKIWNQIW